MSSLIKRQASTFVVDFGDVDIPSGLAKELEAEIQEVALSALARIDFRGDIRIGRLPPGTYGMIFGDWPPDLFPFPFDDKPQPGVPDIQVRDHTIVMGEVMKHGVALTRMLAGERRSGRRVSGAAVLQALLDVPSVPDGIKRPTSAILSQTRDGMPSEKDLPRSARSAMTEIFKELDASQSVDETAKLLRKLGADDRYMKVEGLPEVLRIVGEIVNDGRSTIYSADNPFYEGLGGGGGNGTTAKEKGASDVVKEDVKGGITGGMGGLAAGPKGALAGAVGGALLGSAAEAISQLWDSIFG